MTKKEAGAIGGKVTFIRYGRPHMQAIGRRGFAATVERHWSGDRQAFVRRLHELGLMAQDPYPANGAWQFPKRDGEPW